MVDLRRQLEDIRPEVNSVFNSVLDKSDFIQGKAVEEFEKNLSEWVGVKHVISCANGTDALQLAFMALGLRPGDEVIVPNFTCTSSNKLDIIVWSNLQKNC